MLVSKPVTYEKTCFLIVAAFFVLQGCASYRPMPLDRAAVERALKTPGMDVIRAKAGEIKHPILKPVVIDLEKGLSPDGAAVLAVILNPGLRAVRDRRGIARAELLQAHILPNPQLSYNMDFPVAGLLPGTVTALGGGLGWDVVPLITRNARIDEAAASAASVDLDIAWQEWQVAQAARLHVYRLFFIEKELEAVREEEKRLGENLETFKKGAEIGAVTVVDLAAARAALERANASVLAVERRQSDERLALNRTLGLPPERAIALEKDISPLSARNIPPQASIIEGLEERRLDLLALQKGYRSQDARLRAAVLAQFPRIGIGLTGGHDNTGVVSAGFGITMDLPVFDRNQGAIALEEATRKKLFDEYTARLFEARSEVALILVDMKSTEARIHSAEELIPALKNLVETYRRALLEGIVDAPSYYNARSDLLAREMEELNLKLNLAEQNIALEVAAGEYLGRQGAGR